LFLDPPEADAGKLEAWEAGRLNGQGRSSWLQIAGSGSGEAGFTLIEVIAALIIVSVLAAMIFPVTGGGMWRTARGVGECRELFELQGQMEEIVRLYKTGLADGDGAIDLEDFKNSVESYSFVDSGSTGFLTESGSNLTLTTDPTSLLLVTLTAGDQRIANIFSQ
jgi:prepilin-type N-terminal cleavage/methylation domain-containing protein